MKFTLVLCAFIFAAFFFACKPNSRLAPQLSGSSTITKTVYPVGDGWGYRIFTDGKIFIQQDFIPAVEGQHSFKTKQDADKIASLVIIKLQHHQRPFVTEGELAANGVK